MDKTSEFFAYFNTLQPTPVRSVKQKPKISQDFQAFYQNSKEINFQLQTARQFVADFSSYTFSNNILNENDPQIQALIMRINTELKSIDNHIAETEQLKSKPHDSVMRIQTMRSSLANVATSFKSVMEKRTELLNKQKQRRGDIGFTGPSSVYNTVYSTDDEVDIPIPSQDVGTMEQNNERYGMVRDVERAISEISQMFVRLADVIAQQDFQVQRIDEATKGALDNFLEGQKQLEEYYKKIMNNKWLILKIFGILMVFILIFVLVM